MNAPGVSGVPIGTVYPPAYNIQGQSMEMRPIVSGRTPVQITEDPPGFYHDTLDLRYGSTPRTRSEADSVESTRRDFSTLAVAPRPWSTASHPPAFVTDDEKILDSISSYVLGQENQPPPAAPPAPFSFMSVPFQKQEPHTGVSEGDSFVQAVRPPVLGPSASFVGDVRPKGQQQTQLGMLQIDQLTPEGVLFTFGVLSIMANLNPQFTFQYGKKKNIGVKLVLYGHTVLVQPLFQTTLEARVRACSLALSKLQLNDPQWLSPPLPDSWSSSTDWDWVFMLETYAAEMDLGLPLYNPITMTPDGGPWFCDIRVDNQVIKGEVPSPSMGQAQNTAAHNALFNLLVAGKSNDVVHASNEGFRNFNLRRSPLRDPQTQAPIPLTKRQRKSLNKALNLAGAKGISAAKVVKPAAAGKAQTRRSRGANRGGHKALPEPERGPNNSNLVPLENSRLGPPLTMEKTVDQLQALKDLQEGLRSLPREASYFSLLKKICEILKVHMPEVRVERGVSDSGAEVYLLQSYFDSSHPCLHRASPVKMATFNQKIVTPQAIQIANALGIKKVIYFLIDMVREDCQVDEKAFLGELRSLSTLQREVYQDIQSQKAELESQRS